MRSIGLTAIALCAALACTGCHKPKRVPVATFPPVIATPAAPPPAPPVEPPEPTPPPPPAPAPSPLEQADKAFVAGSYDDAARGYENYLRTSPTGTERDQALFHLGLSYAFRPNAATDWWRVTATFKQLIDEYPQSPFKAPANLILSLRAELDQVNADAKQRDQKIKQLTTELDRLKKIDADRRKRP